jgi:hypothetical protein
MKAKSTLSVAIASLLFICSTASAQLISEDFSNPDKAINDSATATVGAGGLGFAYDGNFGTWVYTTANMGINDAAAGTGLGDSNNNAIASVGVARAQDERGTNVRMISVVFDGDAFTDGQEYTLSFDVLGDASGSNTGDFWLAEFSDTDTSGSNYIQIDGTHKGGTVPFVAVGSASVDYITNGISYSEAAIVGETVVGPTLNSFNFTYSAGTDIAFAVGAYNNIFAIDNFQISAIPESSSYALLAGCLALTSVMIRRRR